MSIYDSTAVGKVISDLYAQVEEQKKRANIYREELLDSHDVINKLEEENKKIALLREHNEQLSGRVSHWYDEAANHALTITQLRQELCDAKTELSRIKKMLEAVLSS